MATSRNVRTHIASTGASEGASMIGTGLAGRGIGKIAGGIVQPVVWIATGKGPDAIDSALYLMSFATRMISIPVAVTGLIKAMVDDATLQKLKEVRNDEPVTYAELICPTSEYEFAGRG